VNPTLVAALKLAAMEAYVAAVTTPDRLETVRLTTLGDTLEAQARSEDRTVVACGK
jgi:hypothetical protein